ncbi:hypothetical protein ACTHGU_21940 [Chitinophagaceae bacterium MMS25-I14]
MAAIKEGNLVFTFPNDWRVIKYDETKFYRHKMEPTGAELAAVDFLISPPDYTHLILLEVKDFRNYEVENRKRQSATLPLEVIRKALHTLSAIYLVAYTQNKELGIFCDDSLFPPERITIILFMEEDIPAGSHLKTENYRKRVQGMQLKLNRLKYSHKVGAKILSTSLLEERDGFSVAQV